MHHRIAFVGLGSITIDAADATVGQADLGNLQLASWRSPLPRKSTSAGSPATPNATPTAPLRQGPAGVRRDYHADVDACGAAQRGAQSSHEASVQRQQ